MFERLREALDALLDGATPPGEPRSAMGMMEEAVVEAKAAIMEMREQLEDATTRLAKEEAALADAERRGKLAAGIDDAETVKIAEEFADKHREKAGVLRRKRAAIEAELALATREFESMKAQLKRVRQQGLGSEAAARVDAAWRDVESIGGSRPRVDPQADVLKSQMDRAAREALADQQLEELKKKMGR